MAIAVQNVTGGPATGAANAGDTSAAFTSVTGSLIVDLAGVYNTAGSPAGTDTTDSKSNTYTQFDVNNVPSVNQPGIEVNYNNAGTRGSSHTVSSNGPGGGDFNFTDVIEVTGFDPNTIFDTTLTAHSSQTFTTAWSVTTAAAPGAGTTLLIACFHADTGVNSTITDPSGWTLIWKKTNGSTEVVNCAYYKIVTNPGSAQTCAPTWGGVNGDITKVVGTILGVNEARIGNLEPVILPESSRFQWGYSGRLLDRVGGLIFPQRPLPSVGSQTAVGVASEIDTAVAVAGKGKSVGVALETDTAVAVTAKKTKLVGTANETDTAQAVTPRKARAVGVASEVDNAIAIGVATVMITNATEVDTAQALRAVKSKAVTVATEIDTAQAIVKSVKTKLIGVAAEVDTAQVITRAGVVQPRRNSGIIIGVGEGVPKKIQQ